MRRKNNGQNTFWCQLLLTSREPGRRSRSLNWKVRMGNEDFTIWWLNLGYKSLFFDGASKGNPRIAGVGGVIFDTKGRKQKEYAWGIGRKSNNGA